MPKKLVGIELSSRFLRAIELDGLGGKKPPIVKKYFEKPIGPGIVKDGEVLDVDLMANELRELWAEAKFSTRDVVAGIGNQRILIRNKTIVGVAPENIKSTLQFQVDKDLPLSVDESILDFYPIRHNSLTNETEGLLIAAVKNLIEENVKAFDKAKLNLVRIDLIPFALIRSLIDEVKKETTVIQLFVGSRSTSITIVDKGIPIFGRIIPTGVDEITDSIQKFGVEYDPAVEIMNTLGVGGVNTASDEQKAYRRAINEQVNQLYQSIRNTLKFYQTNNPDKRYKSIIMAGQGNSIPGLQATFKQAFSIPVESGDPTNKLNVSEELAESLKEYSIPIGLVLGV